MFMFLPLQENGFKISNENLEMKSYPVDVVFTVLSINVHLFGQIFMKNRAKSGYFDKLQGFIMDIFYIECYMKYIPFYSMIIKNDCSHQLHITMLSSLDDDCIKGQHKENQDSEFSS